MRTLPVVLISALLAGGMIAVTAQDSTKPAPTAEAPARTFAFPKVGEVPVADEKMIADMIANHGSDYLVVNMWATWCGPCVEELPYFVKVANELDERRVRFVGLSADFEEQIDTVVLPLLRRLQVPYPNLLMDVDMDPFINSVSPRWTGAIPATFVYDRNGRMVGEKLEAVTEAQLRAFLDGVIEGGLASAAKKPPAGS